MFGALPYRLESCEFQSRISHWIFFFNLLNPSIRTMVLGFTQPLTVPDDSGVKERPELKADNLTGIFVSIV
jgi:hypothetical protein